MAEAGSVTAPAPLAPGNAAPKPSTAPVGLAPKTAKAVTPSKDEVKSAASAIEKSADPKRQEQLEAARTDDSPAGVARRQLQGELEATRERISQNVTEIKGQLRGVTNWKRPIEKHPIPAVLAAGLIGYLLAPRKPKPLDVRSRRVVEEARKSATGGGFNIVEAVQSTVLAIFTRRLTKFIEDKLQKL